MMLYYKYNNAVRFKALSNMLLHIVKETCFYFKEDMLIINCIGHYQKCMASVELKGDEVRLTDGVCALPIGLSSNHLHEILSTVTKKDKIEFIIEDGQPNDLIIRISNKTEIMSSYTLRVQMVQHIFPLYPPLDFTTLYTIETAEFQRIISGLNKVKMITISNGGARLVFASNDIIRRRYVISLKNAASDDDGEPFTFEMEQLVKFKKLSAFSSQIYLTSSNYITIYCPIDENGKITIFIKSKELQQEENCSNSDG